MLLVRVQEHEEVPYDCSATVILVCQSVNARFVVVNVDAPCAHPFAALRGERCDERALVRINVPGIAERGYLRNHHEVVGPCERRLRKVFQRVMWRAERQLHHYRQIEPCGFSAP